MRFKSGEAAVFTIVHNKSVVYEQYKEYAKKRPNLHFKGRLGEYQYYNMDQIVRSALDFSKILVQKGE